MNMSMLKNFAKYGSSFITAYVVANFLCYFSFTPPQFATNHEGYTSHKSPPNQICYYSTEGYGRTNIDSFGFNNIGDVDFDSAKIVCIGSSQTLAQGVDTEENYVYSLNDLNPYNKAYSLGCSGQYLNRYMSRIPRVAKKFKQSEVIVMESPHIPTVQEFEKITFELKEDKVKIEDYDSRYKNPVKRMMRALPCNRMLHAKLGDFKFKAKGNDMKVVNDNFDSSVYQKSCNDSFATLRSRVSDKALILVLTSGTKLDRCGDLVLNDSDTKKKQKEIVKNACIANDITFIDMGPYFVEDFNRTKVPSNGFLNSRIATGHINAHGYQVIARVLNGKINELREKGAVR